MQRVDDYFNRLCHTIANIDRQAINQFIDLIEKARQDGNAVFTFGNGGSASTASHMVCDLNKGVSYGREKRLRVICLNDSISTVMAYSNDVGYADVFVEQLRNFCQPKDLVIGLSGSGNSENVLRAIGYARKRGATTIGFCGYDGGKLKQLVDLAVHAPIHDMQIAEDLHLVVLHIATQVLMT
ncbi:MAG: phosphoheptose isomerase [Deltaproteobacteria bacterium RIFOXYA12_FULL_58_15]|nr:MAG: phosphoheptose isomerase [Deltaproteobacteria bacterium RIFOXYA12_FULL_58_15]OGR13910.1 MAG: phosphoheptose isomerase [Deltaproteobacteria bacterium RIFOXYB12_FULL_58_9]